MQFVDLILTAAQTGLISEPDQMVQPVLRIHNVSLAFTIEILSS
jgi:hypothetical protein